MEIDMPKYLAPTLKWVGQLQAASIHVDLNLPTFLNGRETFMPSDDFFASLDKKLTEQSQAAADKTALRNKAEDDAQRFVAEATPIIKSYADGVAARGVRVDTSFHERSAEIVIRYKDGDHYGLRIGFVHSNARFGVQDLFSENGKSYASEPTGPCPPDYVSSGNFEKKLRYVLEQAMTYSDKHGGFDKPQNF